MADRSAVNDNVSPSLAVAEPTSNPNLNSNLHSSLAFGPKAVDSSTSGLQSATNASDMDESTAAALPDVHRHVSTTDFVIRKEVFGRLVKGVVKDLNAQQKFDLSAVNALQKSAEDYLVTTFQYANISAIENKRETLQGRDMEAAQKLMKDAMH